MGIGEGENANFSLSLNMDLNKERVELVEMINQIQNAQMLASIKELLADLMPNGSGFELSEVHKEILDRRIEKYQSDKSQMSSWEEVLAETKG